MKKIHALAAAFFFSLSTYAQLSTRQNDSTSVLVGVRPMKGDMALSFGFNLNSLNKDTLSVFGLKTGNPFAVSELLNFKKFVKDDIAIRAGLRLYQNGNKAKGIIADSTGVINVTFPSSSNTIESNIYQVSERQYMIVPGIEKHFSKKNIFDVYAGADLFLGFGRQDSVNKINYTDGDFDRYSGKTNNSIYGIGGVVGFNLFVAQLPLSIGLEYGWDAKWIVAGKTKVNREIKSTTGNTTTTDDLEYYVQGNDPLGQDPTGNAYKYNSLKKHGFYMDTNQQVKLVVNIYFGK